MIIRIRPPQELSFWGSMCHQHVNKTPFIFSSPKSFDQRINLGKWGTTCQDAITDKFIQPLSGAAILQSKTITKAIICQGTFSILILSTLGLRANIHHVFFIHFVPTCGNLLQTTLKINKSKKNVILFPSKVAREWRMTPSMLSKPYCRTAFLDIHMKMSEMIRLIGSMLRVISSYFNKRVIKTASDPITKLPSVSHLAGHEIRRDHLLIRPVLFCSCPRCPSSKGV